jgi:hypothetical protein
MLLVLVLVSSALGDDGSHLCDPNQLPPAVQSQLEKDFTSWKIQQPTDLSSSARQRWHSETPLACPGIVAGHMQSAGQSTYVLLLVPRNGGSQAYRLIAFSPGNNVRTYTSDVIERWDQGGSSQYFIHGIQIDKVFSAKWVSKLHVKAREGFLFVDAAESEYEANVYFWADGHYRHEPIDY